MKQLYPKETWRRLEFDDMSHLIPEVSRPLCGVSCYAIPTHFTGPPPRPKRDEMGGTEALFALLVIAAGCCSLGVVIAAIWGLCRLLWWCVQ